MKKIILGMGLIFLNLTTIADGNKIPITLTYKLLQGDEIREYLPFILEESLKALREYPYLYEPTYAEQEEAWLKLMQWHDNAVVIAYNDNKPIGYIAGVSLVDFDQRFTGVLELFEKNNLNPRSYYYITECIIVPEFRGLGIVQKLGEVLEPFIRQHDYVSVCFVTEDEDINHPKRPINYRSHDSLWIRKGFRKTAFMTIFNWEQIELNGSKTSQQNKLIYWIKDI